MAILAKKQNRHEGKSERWVGEVATTPLPKRVKVVVIKVVHANSLESRQLLPFLDVSKKSKKATKMADF